jgi:hypothetical protein
MCGIAALPWLHVSSHTWVQTGHRGLRTVDCCELHLIIWLSTWVGQDCRCYTAQDRLFSMQLDLFPERPKVQHNQCLRHVS